MADNTLTQEFELVLVSYKDVAEAHPTWSDQAIEDYQARFRSLVLTAEVTGGSLDRIIALEDAVALLDERVTYLEGLTIVTAVDLTIDNAITGHQSIVCTAAVIIKLDATPIDRDTAAIKVGQKNTKVIIDGNGKLIEEDTTMILRSRNTKRQIGMDLEYSASLDKWFTT